MSPLSSLWTQFLSRCQTVIHSQRYGGHRSMGDRADAHPTDAQDEADQVPSLYRDIVEAQAELICRYRPDTTIIYVNSAYCRYFGLQRADLINRSYQPVIYEGDRASVAQQVARMTCANPAITIENRVIVRGEMRWTQWNNRCFCDQHGQITAYQSVGRDISQLKAIEHQLRNSETRYRSLIEAIPQLVWVTNPEGLTASGFNQRWLEFTGQTEAAAQGRGWLAVVHPDDLETVVARWTDAVAQGRNYEAEYRLRRADGVYVWHLAQATPSRDAQGQITGWYGTCTDISDRKRTEAQQQAAESALQQLNASLETRIAERTAELLTTNQALKQEILERRQAELRLKQNEENLQQAIVNAPFPIFIHAEDGTILQMSQAVTDLTGYDASELSTLQSWLEKAYSDRQQLVSASINQLYELKGRLEEGEFEITTSHGEKRFWLFSSASLGQLNDGRRLVISMAADVTQQKRSEADLAIRLRQQAVVTQLSQVALSGLSLQTLFNQATQLLADSLDVEYCKVLELQPDGDTLLVRAGVGWSPGIVGRATVSNDCRSQAGYTLQSHEPILVTHLPTEKRFQGPTLLTDHEVISGMSTLIAGEGDRPYGILGVHSTRQRCFTQNDVNFLQSVANLLAAAIRRHQTEAELNYFNQTLEERIRDRTQTLQEVNEELAAFSYSIAHDLRAPLRAIQGFARVLQADYGPQLDQLGQEYIGRMATSAEYLDTLIQDLLAYSQLGRTDITLRCVSIDAVLSEVLIERQPTIKAKAATITLASSLPSVYAQRSILRQILNNLIGNALKFVAPGTCPHIQIWAEERLTSPTEPATTPDRRVKLWIQDNGIGIALRHQDRIFKPFERLHGIEAYPGTGIGLSIVQRGVERMGGQIGIESAENEGSRFWIELDGC